MKWIKKYFYSKKKIKKCWWKITKNANVGKIEKDKKGKKKYVSCYTFKPSLPEHVEKGHSQKLTKMTKNDKTWQNFGFTGILGAQCEIFQTFSKLKRRHEKKKLQKTKKCTFAFPHFLHQTTIEGKDNLRCQICILKISAAMCKICQKSKVANKKDGGQAARGGY